MSTGNETHDHDTSGSVGINAIVNAGWKALVEVCDTIHLCTGEYDSMRG